MENQVPDLLDGAGLKSQVDMEGTSFWLSWLTGRKNRGLKDIFIARIDGLAGFAEALRVDANTASRRRRSCREIPAFSGYGLSAVR